MQIKNVRVDFLIVTASILSLLYSPFIFFFTILTITGVPFFGDLPTPSIRPETVLFFVIGLLYLIYPLWLLRIKKKQRLTRWMEYIVLLMAMSPLLLYFILSLS